MGRRLRAAGDAAAEHVGEGFRLVRRDAARNQPGALAEHGVAEDRRRGGVGGRVSRGGIETQQFVASEPNFSRTHAW